MITVTPSNSTSSSASSNTGVGTVKRTAEIDGHTGSTDDSVTVSTRAEKLNQLSNEFFNGGIIQIKELPQLIQRLEEYGFITSDEAKDLGHIQSDLDDGLEGEISEVSAFIDSLSEVIAKDETNNGLFTALENAKSVIENLDRSQSPVSKVEVAKSTAEIKAFLNSDRSAGLSDKNRQQLGQINRILGISSHLQNYQVLNNGVNQYLSNSYSNS